MIRRRILRRVALLKVPTVEAFADHLREHPDAVKELYQDLLITVTSFFRDSEVYRLLKTRIFPDLLESRPSGSALRIWVPACSTGEEVYSLAIALFEYLGQDADRVNVQIFATDLSEEAIERARSGIYTQRQVEGLSAERLRRYFRKAGEEYQISKRIRDVCIFARQNLVKDPPFSRMDIISCQNLLIYFDADLQRRALEIFHYSLTDRGFLILGASESASALPDLFAPLSKKHRVYQRRAAARPVHLGFSGGHYALPGSGRPGVALQADQRAEPDVMREVDRAVLALHAPPGVLVNDRMEIVQFRGSCSPYIEPLPGVASFSLFRMLKADLAIQIRPLIARATRTPGIPTRQRVNARIGNETVDVDLEVLPVHGSAEERTFYLISFIPMKSGEAHPEAAPAQAPDRGSRSDKALATSLHRELIACKEQLRTVVEESETKNEELKSAMEEVTSSNEELQSINEELETAKEELQSTNEELSTVNDELQNRNIELTLFNADLNNFIASVEIPIVMLGGDLTVRRFTPSAAPLLNLRPTDIGRPLIELRPTVEVPGLEAALERVVATGQSSELDGTDKAGREYSIWLRPYVSSEAKVDGAVVVVLDISERRRSEVIARESADRFRTVLMNMPVLLVAYDEQGLVKVWNAECERVTGYTATEVVGNAAMRTRILAETGGPSRPAPFEERSAEDYRGWVREITCKDGAMRRVVWSNVSRLFPIPGWASWEVGIALPDSPPT
ncbi:MAG: PAS domain-containing protein [Candidatus Sericytochromatia bacterium]|nr:PAS domain-containing protein [Candidatus Tanganyikabacteria bacterium]